MPGPTDSSDKSFLGGGPRFNQAGENAPMPGEKVADAVVSPLPFGGPRVWIGVLVVLVLIGVLWFVFGGGVPGTQPVGHHGNGSLQERPSNNPDQLGR